MTKQLQADELTAGAVAWIEGDPDDATREALQQILDSGDRAALAELVGCSLRFGTAGLRGIVGPGPNRMNRAVVLRTTRALAQHVRERVLDGRALPVVVGFDGRTNSREWARDAAEVLAAAGIPVRTFDEPAPTPLVAFAAKELGAAAAVVITASHNPPEYNGYKVFGADGAQIIPPVDDDIASRLGSVGSARAIARSGFPPERIEPVGKDMVGRYVAALSAQVPRARAERDLVIVHTALHGVGWPLVRQALADNGFSRVLPVESQAQPDGAFPTVAFPNPEEPGAMAAALELAEAESADLVLANDPDADRLAVAVPTPTGRWVQLSGNHVGVLLADFLLAAAPRAPRPLVVSSIVSSPMIEALADAHGARSERTLTGFKWIAAAALRLEREGGVRFVFGYEEALGYTVGHAVRDKDGIGAALAFAELAAQLRASGETVLERLAALHRRHGLWASAQHNVVRPGVEGRAEIDEAMRRLTEGPPSSIGGFDVERVEDFREGAARRPAWLPASPLVALHLAGGGRALVRPSGTEPKLKIYADLRGEVGDAPVAELERDLTAKAAALASAVAEAMALG